MIQQLLQPKEKKVEYVELIYDLIFVYVVGRNNALLHIFENGDHGFCLGRDPYEPWKLESVHACTAWVPLAKTFLMHQISPETAENEKEVFGKLAASMPNPAVKPKEE